ncbi:hypothetical protein [Parapedobacter tibetensis]|uniref:hypothetical protein n=1 Tax=Parapedobacter tibetensis TaxID=2972951 RepID=UPI00214D6EDE|nr:hypothetical protein [Parapedobacter tibetensis]
MQTLNVNWFVEVPIDFEHKQYQLLAYLQQINAHFNHTQLYPNLNDLVFHYNNLKKFKKDKTMLETSFPVRLSNIDVAAVTLTYEKIINDDAMMQEIEQIINYATFKIKPAIKEGQEIHDFVESHLAISEVGVRPLYPYHGYLLLRNGGERGVRVYEYQVTLFENQHEKYRGIHTTFITKYEWSFIYSSAASIRKDLIQTRRELPNPAVYQVESDITFPLENTLLPLAKKTLVKTISTLS